jgi:hypothetical protein
MDPLFVIHGPLKKNLLSSSNITISIHFSVPFPSLLGYASLFHIVLDTFLQMTSILINFKHGISKEMKTDSYLCGETLNNYSFQISTNWYIDQ